MSALAPSLVADEYVEERSWVRRGAQENHELSGVHRSKHSACQLTDVKSQDSKMHLVEQGQRVQ
jgi:hypothetical protein